MKSCCTAQTLSSDDADSRPEERRPQKRRITARTVVPLAMGGRVAVAVGSTPRNLELVNAKDSETDRLATMMKIDVDRPQEPMNIDEDATSNKIAEPDDLRDKSPDVAEGPLDGVPPIPLPLPAPSSGHPRRFSGEEVKVADPEDDASVVMEALSEYSAPSGQERRNSSGSRKNSLSNSTSIPCVFSVPQDVTPRGSHGEEVFKAPSMYSFKSKDLATPSRHQVRPDPRPATTYSTQNIRNNAQPVDYSRLFINRVNKSDSDERKSCGNRAASHSPAPPDRHRSAPQLDHPRPTNQDPPMRRTSQPYSSTNLNNPETANVPRRPRAPPPGGSSSSRANPPRRAPPNGPMRPPTFIDWINMEPFLLIDELLGPLFRPNGGFGRGFDEQGFFFFGMQPNQQRQPQGATAEQIREAIGKLKPVSDIKKGDVCPICLEQFRTVDDVVEMPCPCKRTFFHRKCAIETLEKTKKIQCTNCRKWDG